jgi:hypothetical protein
LAEYTSLAKILQLAEFSGLDFKSQSASSNFLEKSTSRAMKLAAGSSPDLGLTKKNIIFRFKAKILS